jgi:hypothetical protein
MSDRFDLALAIGRVLRNSRPCKNPPCRALIKLRAKGSGRQPEYCSQTCQKRHYRSLRTQHPKRLTCKNCGTQIQQPTGRGRARLWCSMHCAASYHYRTNREHRLALSKAWREANPERVKATRRAWREANKKVKAREAANRRPGQRATEASETAFSW